MLSPTGAVVSGRERRSGLILLLASLGVDGILEGAERMAAGCEVL